MEHADQPPSPPHRRLRRLGVGLATLLVALAGFVALLLFFESRDSGQVSDAPSAAQGPGLPVAHQARARTPAAIRRDATRLSRDQLLHALQVGDVVLLYGGSQTPPAALRALQQRVSGSFDPVLAANGAAVILAYQPGAQGVTALAWRRILRTASPADPALGQFVDYWLSRAGGASG